MEHSYFDDLFASSPNQQGNQDSSSAPGSLSAIDINNNNSNNSNSQMAPHSVIPAYALTATNNTTGITQPFSGPTSFPTVMTSFANATQDQILNTPTPHYDMAMPTLNFTPGIVQSQQVQQAQYVQQTQTQVQPQVQDQVQPQSQLLCGDYLTALLGFHNQQLSEQLHTSATTPVGSDADDFANMDLGQVDNGGTWPNVPADSQDYVIQAPTLPSQCQGFDVNTLPSSILPFNEQNDTSYLFDSALLDLNASMSIAGSVVNNNTIGGVAGASSAGTGTATSDLDLAFAGQQQQQPILLFQNLTQQQQLFPYDTVPMPAFDTSAAIDYGMAQQQQFQQQQQQQQASASPASTPSSLTSLSSAIEQYNLQNHQYYQQQQQHETMQQFNPNQQLQLQQQQVQDQLQTQVQFYGSGLNVTAAAATAGSSTSSSFPPVVAAPCQNDYHPLAAWTVNPYAGMVIPATTSGHTSFSDDGTMSPLSNPSTVSPATALAPVSYQPQYQQHLQQQQQLVTSAGTGCSGRFMSVQDQLVPSSMDLMRTQLRSQSNHVHHRWIESATAAAAAQSAEYQVVPDNSGSTSRRATTFHHTSSISSNRARQDYQQQLQQQQIRQYTNEHTSHSQSAQAITNQGFYQQAVEASSYFVPPATALSPSSSTLPYTHSQAIEWGNASSNTEAQISSPSYPEVRPSITNDNGNNNNNNMVQSQSQQQQQRQQRNIQSQHQQHRQGNSHPSTMHPPTSTPTSAPAPTPTHQPSHLLPQSQPMMLEDLALNPHNGFLTQATWPANLRGLFYPSLSSSGAPCPTNDYYRVAPPSQARLLVGISEAQLAEEAAEAAAEAGGGGRDDDLSSEQSRLSPAHSNSSVSSNSGTTYPSIMSRHRVRPSSQDLVVKAEVDDDETLPLNISPCPEQMYQHPPWAGIELPANRNGRGTVAMTDLFRGQFVDVTTARAFYEEQTEYSISNGCPPNNPLRPTTTAAESTDPATATTGYRCRSAEGLDVDAIVPNTGGPLNCSLPHCMRTFPTIGLLKSHMVSHNDQKPYWCDVCSPDGIHPYPISPSQLIPGLPVPVPEVKRYKRHHDLLRHKREQHPPTEVKLQRYNEKVAAKEARKKRAEETKKAKALLKRLNNGGSGRRRRASSSATTASGRPRRLRTSSTAADDAGTTPSNCRHANSSDAASIDTVNTTAAEAPVATTPTGNLPSVRLAAPGSSVVVITLPREAYQEIQRAYPSNNNASSSSTTGPIAVTAVAGATVTVPVIAATAAGAGTTVSVTEAFTAVTAAQTQKPPRKRKSTDLNRVTESGNDEIDPEHQEHRPKKVSRAKTSSTATGTTSTVADTITTTVTSTGVKRRHSGVSTAQILRLQQQQAQQQQQQQHQHGHVTQSVAATTNNSFSAIPLQGPIDFEMALPATGGHNSGGSSGANSTQPITIVHEWETPDDEFMGNDQEQQH
ncbi:MAG: hypothetical protein J3R72DRAFT_500926 [Linnemannia gamsii]|nr:MAG: hypothetical protein J3R72DRAFT_500926 [Linnemannia gamsii]